jgi:20S proteasome subunit beta 1
MRRHRVILCFFSIFLFYCSGTEVDLGTTLVAIRYKDGVVVGADTRTSVGTYVSNRYSDKIEPVLNTAVICRSGSAADTQYLAEQVNSEFQARYYRYVERPNIRQIAYLLRSLVTENMSASLICAGYDPEKGGQIYSITPNGSIIEEEQEFAVSGSGSTYVLGHMDNFFKPDMEEDDAITFVVNTIQLAISRDGSSGGFVRVHTVNREGSKVTRVYPDHHVPLSIVPAKAVELKGFAAPKRESLSSSSISSSSSSVIGD